MLWDDCEHIKLESVIEDDISSIIGDPAKIQLAVIYLLMNAEEAVADQKDKRVRVHVKDTPEGPLVEVWNAGPPIPEYLHDAIFEKHHTDKESHHLGLGLPAARAISALHDGSVTYDEKRGFQMLLQRENSLQELI